MKNNILTKSGLKILTLFLLSSCSSVPLFQKVNLTDYNMELKPHDCEQFETAFESYREGASGGVGGKVGGGCGCN